MALIICSECGKEISDKSDVCIHCGCPLINYTCTINGIEYNLKEELTMALVDNEDWMKAIGSLRRKTNLGLSDGGHLIDIIRDTKKIPSMFTPEFPLENRRLLYGDDQRPKCPTCGSTDISKISTVSRAVSVGIFGLASSKIGKTHKCNNCGTTW